MSFIQQYLQSRAEASSPAYAKQMQQQRDQSQRQDFLTELMGTAPVAAVNTHNMPEFDQLPPEMQNEYGSAAQPGSGYLAGNMQPNELALRLMQGPTASTRAVGGSILNQLLKPRDQQKQQPVSFGQYQQFDDQKRADFDQFKGRRGQQPLVNINTGVKYPGGRMLSGDEVNQYGLPSNSRYWLKGDGSAPSRVGNFTDFQAKAANFGNQMVQSGISMDRLEAAGYQANLDDNLGTVGAPQAIAAFMRSPQGQIYDAHATEWLMAHLRKDSGAAITQGDMDQARRKYFYSPGDTTQTMKAKAIARQREEAGTIKQSGGAYADFFGGADAKAKAEMAKLEEEDATFKPFSPENPAVPIKPVGKLRPYNRRTSKWSR